MINCSHLSTGQEAVAVGIEHAITKEDNVVPPSELRITSRLSPRTDVMDLPTCVVVL